ncbi:uncharacterized protein TRIADDRAFT_55977 [Trichoplax adhaerens]|uniref:ubiquitinyl hydrolase 1 n=1 Tax=Trichoplax adhaerens TaxID=10228 RepID=B3RTM4_TRIAD|nr:hypothetical protein TRIADDRAFT_55977 [Trichoplax adhaerens]EDV26154.1 hypothetical protein TRIADDRAFT_55977 [Trichoplax adhaerens]|eukprot:XP_002112187.1 hypothetical protein TRIADDRAFT_55977 [Trichoplax adhaerens]
MAIKQPNGVQEEEHIQQSTNSPEDDNDASWQHQINQLYELTGKPLEEIRKVLKACNGNLEKALEMFNTNNQESATQPTDKDTLKQADKITIDLTSDKMDDDIARAVEISLQETNVPYPDTDMPVTQPSDKYLTAASSDQYLSTIEEQNISRVIEASYFDNNSNGTKRKRNDSFSRMPNPYELKRGDAPVGLKNVGNSCWFNAVIQSLFHLPVVRQLVLDYRISEEMLLSGYADSNPLKSRGSIIFIAQLQPLFALLAGSERKYIEPHEYFKQVSETFRSETSGNSGGQQDVNEFTHKLLEWLEDAFEICIKYRKKIGLLNDDSPSILTNPITEFFFGKVRYESEIEGKGVTHEDTFGGYPLKIQGCTRLYECLEVNTRQNMIGSMSSTNQTDWFLSLPPIFMLELSRFEFHSTLGRAEKIHSLLEFEQTLYMDRFLESNKDVTTQRQKVVYKLKKELKELKRKLEKYTSFGNDSKRLPIKDILQYTLNFALDVRQRPASSDQEACDSENTKNNIDMDVDTASYSDKDFVIDDKNPMSLFALNHEIDHEELITLEKCIKRWSSEITKEVDALREKIASVEEAIEQMFQDDDMRKVKYHLHAVLVHAGQVDSGHYWAFIYWRSYNKWLKINDVQVYEVTWEEVKRESRGGGRSHTSAYCLIYISDDIVQCWDFETDSKDKIVDSLSPALHEVVRDHNTKFYKALKDWEERSIKLITCQPRVNKCVIPTFTNRMVLTYLALEASFRRWCTEKIRQFKEIVRKEDNSKEDIRLIDFGIYLIVCKVSSPMLEWAIIESACNDGCGDNASLQKLAEVKWEKICANDIYCNYQDWKDKYHNFLKVNVHVLTGMDLLVQTKYAFALPHFNYAYVLNDKFRAENHTLESVDQHLIGHYRRQALLNVNEAVVRMFKEAVTEEDVNEVIEIVTDTIIPMLSALSKSSDEDDERTKQNICNTWVMIMEGPMDATHSETLMLIISKIFPEETQEIDYAVKPPTVTRRSNSQLYEMYVQVMKKVREDADAPDESDRNGREIRRHLVMLRKYQLLHSWSLGRDLWFKCRSN